MIQLILFDLAFVTTDGSRKLLYHCSRCTANNGFQVFSTSKEHSKSVRVARYTSRNLQKLPETLESWLCETFFLISLFLGISFTVPTPGQRLQVTGEPTCLNQWGWETWGIQVPHPESRAAQRAEAGKRFLIAYRGENYASPWNEGLFPCPVQGCWNETSHIHTLTVWTPKIGASAFLFQAFEKDSKCSFSSRCSCESD